MVTYMNTPHTDTTYFDEPSPCSTTEAEIARRLNITSDEIATLDDNIRRTVVDWIRRSGMAVDHNRVSITIHCNHVEEAINFPDATEHLDFGILAEHIHPDSSITIRSRFLTGTPLLFQRGEIQQARFSLALQQKADIHA